MDLGLSAGWIYLAKCQEYSLNHVTNSYVMEANKDGKFIPFPVVTDLRLGLVYHFGKMPLSQQYRWRYEADSAFHVLVDSLAADRQAKWEQKQIDKSYAIYIKPVKTIIEDARKTLNSWPDSLYSYPRMVLERAIEQAVRDSSEILPPVYVNKGIVYDKDADQKIEIIKNELDYYRGRAESYVAKERRIKFVADSIYNDSVQRVLDDSISTMKRNKFVADSLRKDSITNAKRLKFVNDSIYKDSVNRAKEALSDSLKAAKLEARERLTEAADSLSAVGDEETGAAPESGDEVVPIEPTESQNTDESTEQPVAEDQSPTEQSSEQSGDDGQSSNDSGQTTEESQSAQDEQSSNQSEETNESQDNGGGEETDTSNNEESAQENSNNESEQTETSNEGDNNGNDE